MLQAFLETFDVAWLLEELQDGTTLAFWEPVPLAVLRDVEAALIEDIGDVAGALS